MKNNIFKIGFFCLLIINGVLAFVMLNHPRPPMPGPQAKADLMFKISNELNLSESQKESFFTSAENHQKGMAMIERQQKRLVKEYFEYLKNPHHQYYHCYYYFLQQKLHLMLDWQHYPCLVV